MVGIYKITSPSGRIYIGQSWRIEGRFITYRNVSCPEQSILYRSLKKYGPKNHVFEIVQEFPKDINQDALNAYELFCISQYKEAGVGLLNIREGGGGGGFMVSRGDEWKRKISQARKGTKSSEEAKAKISKSLIGNQRTLGRKASEETRAKLKLRPVNKSMLGRKHTDETKRKMSESSRASLNKKPMPRKPRKKYTFFNPGGEEVTFIGLDEFCKNNNLSAGCMCMVSKGKMAHYKGWRHAASLHLKPNGDKKWIKNQ